MENLGNVEDRFYFCYAKPESDYLKSKGFYYIMKAIHPKTKWTYTMYDKCEELMNHVVEYRNMKNK